MYGLFYDGLSVREYPPQNMAWNSGTLGLQFRVLKFPLKWVIFNSYVELPEGSMIFPLENAH